MSNRITKLRVVAKCSDLCWIGFEDENGERVGERDGYVPDFMPGQHFGDYVEIDINVATGRIVTGKH